MTTSSIIHSLTFRGKVTAANFETQETRAMSYDHVTEIFFFIIIIIIYGHPEKDHITPRLIQIEAGV